MTRTELCIQQELSKCQFLVKIPLGLFLARPAYQKGSLGPLWKLSGRQIRPEGKALADLPDLTAWLALAFEELRAIYILLMELSGWLRRPELLYKYCRLRRRVSESKDKALRFIPQSRIWRLEKLVGSDGRG